jgi:hypothetical protein
MRITHETQLRGLWQIDNAISPIPFLSFILPKACQKSGLIAVIRTPNSSAKENQSGMVLSGAKQLPRVPRKCGAVKRHQNQLGSEQQINKATSSKPSQIPSSQFAM